MNSTRPVPWVSQVLYGSVLVAGLYAELAGLGDTNLPVFLAGFAGLVAVEIWNPRREGGRWAVFLGRAGLLLTVAAADGSGMARVLLVLIPFHAYFLFGRRAGVWIGVGCVGVAVAAAAWTNPRLMTDVEQLSDLLMFALGVALAIAMAAAAVDERRYRARIAALSAAEERNRVARDIHDGLGHHLTAIIVQLEKAAVFRERDPAAAQHSLDNAARSAKQALHDVRRSVDSLHTATHGLPRVLPAFSVEAALRELVDGGDISVTLDGDEHAHPVAVREALFRAAQEGITNARRHARAGRIGIRLRFLPELAELTVSDDGCGFEVGREGYGLRGMRERVHAVGGHLTIHTRPGNGTRLAVTIPRTPATPGPSP